MHLSVSRFATGRLLATAAAATLLFMVSVMIVGTQRAAAASSGFGLQSFEASELNSDGSPAMQAGAHPYALKTTLVINESIENPESRQFLAAGGGLKDVEVQLPPGFVGNPNAVPKCPYKEFRLTACPDDTAVGETTTALGSSEGFISRVTGKHVVQWQIVTDPVYNIEPPGRIPAELGWWVVGHPILADTSVRTGGDYGITVSVRNITQSVVVEASTVTIWGVPAEAIHDRLRGKCLGQGLSQRSGAENEGHPHNEEESLGVCPANIPAQPFLTSPTSCGEAREAKLSVDDWEDPGNFLTGENVFSKTVALPALEGCEHLDFSPTIGVTPDGTAGSTPTGLNVDVHIAQEATSNPLGLGEADVKDTTVALPAGVQLSPAAADGLQSCSLSQIGLHDAEKPSCPDASKVANVKIATPLLEHELTGAVYLAAPQNFAGIPENPFSSLIALYLVAEEAATGVLVKLAGKVEPNLVTGQLTSTFENTPQLPFSDLKLEFYGTDRAPLATPALCGTYATTTSFTPWSAPESGPPATPSSSFQITNGPNGSPCSDPLLFSPSLQSGSTNINAGSFSPLTTTLSREDGQQNIQQVTLRYPPGLSGVLSGVKLCGETEANAGTCGPESQIGETTVSVGLGNDPFTVTGGRVYLTGPYEGAPFGLSIVNPAKAGPFDLQEGHPVV